jgi:hypothetical protein
MSWISPPAGALFHFCLLYTPWIRVGLPGDRDNLETPALCVSDPGAPAKNRDFDYGTFCAARQTATLCSDVPCRQGRSALFRFDEMGRLAAIEALYLYSSPLSAEQQMARELLTDLTQQPDLSVEQIWETAEALYINSPKGSQARQLGMTLLRELVQRPDLSVEQIRTTAEALYYRSLADSEALHLGTILLRELAQRRACPWSKDGRQLRLSTVAARKARRHASWG